MDSRLKEFVRLFNQKEFFEAHEVLESLWMETESEDKDFYKGLIQCAVAFVHLDRNNHKGAAKLYKTACEYLRRFLPQHGEIKLQELLEEFEKFFATHVRADSPVDLDSIKTPQITTSHTSV